MNEVFTISTGSRYEEKIKGSRFLGIACPISDRQSAEGLVRRFQQDYSDATHVCYAYVVGIDESREFRFSDAGEPAGSAGKPILQAIESRNLTQTLVVVVRYFGGTKLGIGGLIRAYGGCAGETLKRAGLIPFVKKINIKVKAPFAYLNSVMRCVAEFKAEFQENYEDDGVLYMISIPSEDVDDFSRKLKDLSRGQIKITVQS